MNFLAKLLATTALAATAPLASATMIDFNAVPAASGNGTVLGSLTTLGYTFSSTHGHILNSPTSCSGSCASNGTAYLGGDMLNLTMSMGGGIFSVGSFDMAEAFASISIPTTLTLAATYLGGGTSSQTISFDGIYDGVGSRVDFQNVTVNLSNLTELRFTSAGYFGIDNIETSTTSVPEPASFALLGLGLLGLGVARRRRNS